MAKGDMQSYPRGQGKIRRLMARRRARREIVLWNKEFICAGSCGMDTNATHPIRMRGKRKGGGAIGGSEPSTFEREGRRGTVMQDGQGEGFVMRRRRP